MPRADRTGRAGFRAADQFREKTRLLDKHRYPVDQRIEAYLNEHFADLNLDEPLRTVLRSLDNFRERGSPRQLDGVVDLLKARRDAINPPEVEIFARYFGVLDLWQAVLKRVDSAA